MICPKCSAPLADTSRFCSACGNVISPEQAATLQVPPPLPTGPQQTNGKAIASLVCGIISVFPLFIIAIILGHVSLYEIKKSGGRLKGEGLAIAGLVLGYLGIVAIPLLLIVAAIAIPNLLRAKMAANESSAVGSVRNLITAEVTYQATHQNVGFTCNLSDLSGLIDSPLASGQRTGYVFALQGCSSETQGGPVAKFQITAVPVKSDTTGQQAFCADESGVIRLDRTGSAQNCLDHGSLLQ